MTIRRLSILIAVLLANAASANDEVEGTVDRLMSAMEVILDRHIEPPTRQEMVLAVARALDSDGADQRRMSREVSQLAEREDLRKFLVETWREETEARDDASHEALSDRVMAAMLRSVGAGSGLPHRALSDEDYRLDRQFADNRYVGIGIYLMSVLGYPSAGALIEDGPADRAGMKRGDLMVAINGQDMKEVAMPEVIKLLRGKEGEQLTINVRQPRESEESMRTLVFKRGIAPLKTVNYSQHLDGEGEIGVLQIKIQSITGSTLHEMKKAASSKYGANAKAVVLDLRGVAKADRHHTVTLANGLLDGGTIGDLLGIDGARRFEADRECLFRGLPMAVLVDSGTSGLSEWLAAALQDNRRATIVGGHTAGQSYIGEPVPLPDGGAMMLATHRWKRQAWSQYKGVRPDVRRDQDFEGLVRFPPDLPDGFRTRSPSAGHDALGTAIKLLRERIEANEWNQPDKK